MITVLGTFIGIFLARLAGPRERWLRAAMLAQTADLVTFAVNWEHGQGELNPLGGLARSAFLAAFTPALGGGAHDAAVLATSVVLMGLKLGLIGFILWAAPRLGTYRQLVLVLAAAAGTLGSASNVIAYPNAGACLAIIVIYAVVAARRPAQFGAALRAGAGLVAAGLLGIGSLAAASYMDYPYIPFVCGVSGCPPQLYGQLQVLWWVFTFAALIALTMTARYIVRTASRAEAAEPSGVPTSPVSGTRLRTPR